MLPRPLDWSLMVPARPPTPCKSTKSRLPDAEITKGRRSLHLHLKTIRSFCAQKYDTQTADRLPVPTDPFTNLGLHNPWQDVLILTKIVKCPVGNCSHRQKLLALTYYSSFWRGLYKLLRNVLYCRLVIA